jgi:hypothetical protein
VKNAGLLILLLGAVLWGSGCANVPESKLIPVMGYADTRADSAAATEGPAAIVAAAEVVPAAEIDSADALSQTLLILPFRDHSKYSGPWDVSAELARGVGDSLKTNSFYQVVPIDAVLDQLSEKELIGKIDEEKALALGRQLGVDYVVMGDIIDLSMKRFRATVPIGGYRNYKALVTVTLGFIKVIDGRPAGLVKAEIEHDSPRYGITNPAAHVPLDREYYFLGETPWGTEEFHQTLVGQGVGLCLVKLREEVASLVRPPPELTTSEPRVVDIDGMTAYINIGLADSLANGDKFGIWDHGRELRDPDTDQVLGRALPRRVGVIQVEQVLAEKLSITRIIEGQEEIQAGFTLRAE